MMRRYRPYAVSALVSVTVIVTWLSGAGAFRGTLRESAFDLLLPWLVRTPEEPALRVVDIDQETLARYGPWPWPRALLAELIGTVSDARPAAIGLDMLLAATEKPPTAASVPGTFGHSGGPAPSSEGDAAVAAAASRAPTVFGFVLDGVEPPSPLPATPILLRGRPRLPEIWTASSVIGPAPEIAAAAKGFGAIVLLPDADGRIRRVPLLVNAGGTLRPGIAAELMRVALGVSSLLIEEAPVLRIGSVAVPLDSDAQFRIVPNDAAFRRERTLSAARVMADPALRTRLSGRLVLIGSSAPEVGGLRVTSASAATPSVQIQADAIEMLLRGQLPRRPPAIGPIEAAAAISMVFLAVLLALYLRPYNAVLAVVAASLAWVAASAALFATYGLLLDPVGPLATGVVTFGTFALAAYADNEQRARALRASFEQHLAPAVVRRLVESPDVVRLEGEVREITALFTDIEGFTAMSERSDARKLIALVDEYMDAITEVVLSHGGMVDKIVGDAVHAIFNAPLDLPEHPRRACECALAILKVSEELRSRPLGRELGLGRTRIGLETGTVIVGDVGGRRKLDYTAYGTAVNMAARLEAANKEFGSSVCIGPNAAKRLDPSSVHSLGKLRLHGLSGPVEVFTVVKSSERE